MYVCIYIYTHDYTISYDKKTRKNSDMNLAFKGIFRECFD